jgi:hypothetical protein
LWSELPTAHVPGDGTTNAPTNLKAAGWDRLEEVSGKVAYAVISIGGFLGMGEDYVRNLKYDTTLGSSSCQLSRIAGISGVLLPPLNRIVVLIDRLVTPDRSPMSCSGPLDRSGVFNHPK